MAPTIIVGDGENVGDVADELLTAADNQRQVKVRTDLSRPAFEVPDDLYKRYVGRRERSADEQRVNAVDELPPDGDPIEGDELPDAARVVEPGTGDVDQLTGDVKGDELPASARVVEPPSNGDAPDTGDTGTADDGDAGNRANSDPDARTEATPKPRKRAPSRRATNKPPAAAGSNE